MFSLGELGAMAGAELRGDSAITITGLATLESARAGHVSFYTNPYYRAHLQSTRASAVILSPDDADACPTAVLLSANPQLAYARVAQLFAPIFDTLRGIHASAWVSPDAQIAPDAWIGPQAVIEARAVIEDGVQIGAGCIIGTQARIGAGSRLIAQVTVCRGVRIGKRALIHPGAVIGSDGFGLANDGGRWIKIQQLGGVRVGDDVEIGANTTIDRGALDDTVIEDGVKLDNQIQVGHNVRIGAHTAIAGCVGIAGSARIGRYCMIGGGVGIGGHLQIADHVNITGRSTVARSILEPGVYSSTLTVEPQRLWNKISARLRQIDDFARRLIALEQTSVGAKRDR